MLFNSLSFAIFFAITYTLYVVLRRRSQNVLLLVASYVFYGYWDWRFLFLIAASTLVDYACGLGIGRAQAARRRRLLLTLSMGTNLGLLGVFKYFDFFAESFAELALLVNWQVDPFTLGVVLPVGISFYTFQTMSYTMDVYRGVMSPTRNLLDLAVFVAFFPQLVAGPIERASHLLKQIEAPRTVSQTDFNRGVWLIFFGLFKKVFVADNLAVIVDASFSSSNLTGVEVLAAILAFAFQIYGDFSGYSDIARGVSKLMGFDIMLNFRMPYFATSPQDFWRRWHISLSTWLRDYLYIPLGGSRSGSGRTYRNLFLTMLLGGLWHGAAWTFVMWGIYHGGLLAAHRLAAPTLTTFESAMSNWPRLWTLGSIAATLPLTLIGWLIFRAESAGQIFDFGARLLFSFGHLSTAAHDFALLTFYVTPLLLIQVAKEVTGDMQVIERFHWSGRGLIYFVMALLLITAGAEGGRAFIYFQF